MRAEVEGTLADEITRLESEAAESRANIARLKTEAGDKRQAATRAARAAVDRDPLSATAPSAAGAPQSSVEQVHPDEEEVDASAATDYYKL